ncbi:hypothetical protein [Streptomyces sp. RPT161]|uniref:hypothetical protein n=1 Tax=Streptomyces sp. RPT161 TaxID=3015993 RepID=UPI0022B8F81D|nr:hypothetical protein [Streptomyces sp. RPT161]
MAVSLKTLHAMWRGLKTDQIIRVTAHRGTPPRAFDGRVLAVGTEGLWGLTYDDGETHWIDADQLEHAEVH